MLIYPNYAPDKTKIKMEVYKQICENLCYYGSPTLDYQYQNDFNTRQTDFFQEKFKKLSHVDSDCSS